MSIVIFDPRPTIHDYLSPMYLAPMLACASRNNIPAVLKIDGLDAIKDSTVVLNADYLKPEVVAQLKNNGNKIVGFSVTDSSWISQCCRSADHLKNIDLMFMLTGIQKVNHGEEMVMDKDFNIVLEKRQFLPDEDWSEFHQMHQLGRLQSLPYVHAERQADVPAQPYNARSQKALIRGGHHMRRFLLALELMKLDRLDINSGFVTEPYFQDGMNPQFRYCDECRKRWKPNRYYSYWNGHAAQNCTNPLFERDMDLSDLGGWNNRCPQSFFAAATKLAPNVRIDDVEHLLNARWLPQREHLDMLARITFTSDLKWLFSIYAAQRFWDAAMVGCVNLLPARTAEQEYFPRMNVFEHYRVFREDFKLITFESEIDERTYNQTAAAAKALYDDYMRPTDFAIGTPILKRIFEKIEEHAT